MKYTERIRNIQSQIHNIKPRVISSDPNTKANLLNKCTRYRYVYECIGASPLCAVDVEHAQGFEERVADGYSRPVGVNISLIVLCKPGVKTTKIGYDA